MRGAIVLALATIISKLFGSVYTIILQNMIGDGGMGLYNMAYPVYSTLLIISTAGFPVAVSKFVSEYVAIGDLSTASRIYRVSLVLLTIVGLLCAVTLYVAAPFFAQISGDERSVWAIRAIAPALLIVPAMSSMRGYFQGWQMMEPTAISQVFEQLVRVATILVAAYMALRMGLGESMAAAGAAFGAVTGGLAGMLAMGWFFWRYRQPKQRARMTARGFDRPLREERLSTRAITKKLLYYAVPVSLGALVIPIISNVDALTVTNLLKDGGLSQMAATRDFGILSGRAFKLMMFPAALASSIGVALMPSVSAAYALRDHLDTAARALMGLRLTLLFALPAAIGLCLLARPIDIALFRDSAGFHSIQILGFATLFSTLQIALAASLQGVGAVYLPLRSLLIGTAAKIGLNWVLIPRLGIDGAALATVGSYMLACGLNFVALVQLLPMRISWRDLVLKPLSATFIMGAFTFAMYTQWQRSVPVSWDPRLSAVLITLAAVAVAACIYAVALVMTGTLSETEVASLPRVGERLARLLRRMGLFAAS